MGKTIRHYLREAIDYYKLGQYDEALIACENAILLDPQFARAYHGKGLILVKQEKYEDALKNYVKARELAPNDPKIRVELTKLYAEMAKLLYRRYFYKESGLYFRKAIELDRKYEADYHARTKFLFEEAGGYRRINTYYGKAIDEAIDAFKNVLAFNPNYGGADKIQVTILGLENALKNVDSTSHSSRVYSRSWIDEDRNRADIHTADCRCYICMG